MTYTILYNKKKSCGFIEEEAKLFIGVLVVHAATKKNIFMLDSDYEQIKEY